VKQYEQMAIGFHNQTLVSDPTMVRTRCWPPLPVVALMNRTKSMCC